MTAIANLPDIRPSLLLDFANSGRVDPRIQCTRASSATCFGPDGKLRTVAANVPRIDYDPATGKCLGLLVEEGRTNLWLNSATAVAQSFAVTAQAYTLSFEGSGSIALTGAYSGDSSAGTLQSGRRTLTFTASAGSLSCTSSGDVRNVQLEAGAFPTSYIPTEASTVSRAGDVLTLQSTLLRSSEGTFVAGSLTQAPPLANNKTIFSYIHNSVTNNISAVYSATNAVLASDIRTEGMFQHAASGPVVVGAKYRRALGWKAGFARSATNGELTTGGSTNVTPPQGLTALHLGSRLGQNFLNGHLDCVVYYPFCLTIDQLQRVSAL